MSFSDRPVLFRPMKPEEALRLLRAARAAEIEVDEADPAIALSFDTTIKQWIDSSWTDWWLSWPNGPWSFFNWLFGTDFTKTEWSRVLIPERSKTLRDVCEFASRRAKIPDIQPLKILGSQCHPGGVFLAIRALLATEGCSVSDIRPSTSLANYERHGLPKTHMHLVRIVPALWARVDWQSKSEAIPNLLAFVFFVSTIVGGVLLGHSVALGLAICLPAFAGFVASWQWSEKVAEYPRLVRFVGLETFRDLAKAVSADLAPER